MAKWKSKLGLPDAIERREILAGNPKFKMDLGALGAKYLAAGFLADAIDCYERTRDTAKLAEIKALAIERDVFLLARLAKIEGMEIAPADWSKAGENALAAGRDRSAVVAFERAGDAASLATAKEKVAAFRAELKTPTHGRGGLELTA